MVPPIARTATPKMPTAAHKGLLADEACWPGWRVSVDVFMAIPLGEIKSLVRRWLNQYLFKLFNAFHAEKVNTLWQAAVYFCKRRLFSGKVAVNANYSGNPGTCSCLNRFLLLRD
jgi:hypothetical protein